MNKLFLMIDEVIQSPLQCDRITPRVTYSHRFKGKQETNVMGPPVWEIRKNETKTENMLASARVTVYTAL